MEEGRALLKLPYAGRQLRPGGVISGPTLLKLGRRIATADILMWTQSRERVAAKATVAYASPEVV